MPSNLAQYALEVAKSLQQEIVEQGFLYANESSSPGNSVATKTLSEIENSNIYASLREISETLANSYAQIKRDIKDSNRLSWAGTAHEVRQLLSTLLETLAPDNEVVKQDWYKQEPQTKGPTQKQRTRYILQQHNAGSREQSVVAQVTNLDELIGNLVRETYSRASDAAHRFKTQKEVLRILRYFEAFAQDLLNLDD